MSEKIFWIIPCCAPVIFQNVIFFFMCWLLLKIEKPLMVMSEKAGCLSLYSLYLHRGLHCFWLKSFHIISNLLILKWSLVKMRLTLLTPRHLSQHRQECKCHFTELKADLQYILVPIGKCVCQCGESSRGSFEVLMKKESLWLWLGFIKQDYKKEVKC